ncbi:MAG: alanyl-tRNA editing protein [Halodesulfurarchaeum sp.]
MARSLGPDNPDVTRFEPTVEAIDGTEVVLSETYFYPQGGGQPADRGTLGGVQVVDVQETPESVVHVLETEPDFETGEEIAAAIDEEFRTYTRRAHTASHVLYGAGRLLFDDIGYGGFGITNEKVRVDFATSTDVDDEMLVELERLTNRTVWDSRDVSWERMPTEDALDLDGIAFNSATEEGVMADSDTIRVVTVEDWDVAACGGTHVSNTREIGTVSVLERSNPGEGLTRITFAVGPVGIRRHATVHEAALDASRIAGTNIETLPDAIERLENEKESLEADLREMKREVITAELRSLDRIEKDGQSWAVGVIEDVDSNEIGDRAQELVGDVGDVIAVTGGEGRPFVVVAAGEGVDANDVVQSVTDEFGGGGGGGPDFAQGGGLDADPEDVLAFLR